MKNQVTYTLRSTIDARTGLVEHATPEGTEESMSGAFSAYRRFAEDVLKSQDSRKIKLGKVELNLVGEKLE
jgi:hypothetical protein